VHEGLVIGAMRAGNVLFLLVVSACCVLGEQDDRFHCITVTYRKKRATAMYRAKSSVQPYIVSNYITRV
jgi:hypothetical protein